MYNFLHLFRNETLLFLLVSPSSSILSGFFFVWIVFGTTSSHRSRNDEDIPFLWFCRAQSQARGRMIGAFVGFQAERSTKADDRNAIYFLRD